MYVCICRGITEKQLRDAIENESCSMQELSSVLGVGMDCGTCTEFAYQLLEEIKQQDAPGKGSNSSH